MARVRTLFLVSCFCCVVSSAAAAAAVTDPSLSVPPPTATTAVDARGPVGAEPRRWQARQHPVDMTVNCTVYAQEAAQPAARAAEGGGDCRDCLNREGDGGDGDGVLSQLTTWLSEGLSSP
eukprot:Rhum_TRINITY_DN14942_c6_g1::Rhum_TRINITY_DN14942_c6_g1_i1::g.126734::m.126734